MSRHGDGQAEVELTDSSGPATQLVEILVASIEALAGAGEVETACRLAGQACIALRTTDPAAAHRFDALLHRLTRTLTW
ncbi:hypothetical protein [Enhydrobacter sp.]|uniref:hypothetical protein n=1 Tax=Enhydrobacter sp. TaxID=1894999 RepID=UPI002623C608|nr:hypothetical protein [Enhydrobacter sp.]WIM11618.1 MAG: hypothetical protein OJF58_002577 [Enhydrobacter sp.]